MAKSASRPTVSEEVEEKAELSHVEKMKSLYPTKHWQERFRKAVYGRR
jgi:hypothetical protein